MADALHRTTKQLARSVNTPDYPTGTWIINPDLSAVAGFESRYWTITGDTVTLQSPAERAATDAAILASQTLAEKAAAKIIQDELSEEARVLRAVVKLIVDEINALRQWIDDFKVEVALSTSLNNFKSNVAAMPDLPQRNYSIAKTAIDNIIDGE